MMAITLIRGSFERGMNVHWTDIREICCAACLSRSHFVFEDAGFKIEFVVAADNIEGLHTQYVDTMRLMQFRPQHDMSRNSLPPSSIEPIIRIVWVVEFIHDDVDDQRFLASVSTSRRSILDMTTLTVGALLPRAL